MDSTSIALEPLNHAFSTAGHLQLKVRHIGLSGTINCRDQNVTALASIVSRCLSHQIVTALWRTCTVQCTWHARERSSLHREALSYTVLRVDASHARPYLAPTHHTVLHGNRIHWFAVAVRLCGWRMAMMPAYSCSRGYSPGELQGCHLPCPLSILRIGIRPGRVTCVLYKYMAWTCANVAWSRQSRVESRQSITRR